MKNAIGNFIGIALNLYTLGGIIILTALIFPIQEHGIFFLVLSLISFITNLKFSEYSSFASLGKFIPKYFTLFDVMVNGIVSLISLSDLSLLLYRNAIDLFVLILYPASLPNSWITLTVFW